MVQGRRRANCRGPLPAGYAHGERKTFKRGFCKGRQCAEANYAYARARYRVRNPDKRRRVPQPGPEVTFGRTVLCPTCEVPAGVGCVTARGLRLGKCHLARVRAADLAAQERAV